MATSGSVDFSVSRDNLIEDALRTAGIIGIEDSASATQITWAARHLNMIAKAWQAHGIALWARKTGWILPQTGTNEIDLGPTGDHATLSYVQTQTSATADSGATTISVDSITGISDTYNIGIETESGVQWTTVSGAPSGTTVTLAAALTADVAEDAYVWVYQTKIQRPIKILEAYLRNEDGNTEIDIDIVGKAEYEKMPAKENTGLPNILSYDPQLVDGRAYIWPRLTDGKSLIKIVFQRPFEDFDASTDTPDFPQEWYRALWLALAVDVAPAGGLPTEDRKMLKQEAVGAFREAQLNEPEEGSLLLRPDDQGS